MDLRKDRALSHENSELNTDLPELSHDLPELSHDLPELSHDLPELSHDLPELSHDLPELSHDFTTKLNTRIRNNKDRDSFTKEIVRFCKSPKSLKELAEHFGFKDKYRFKRIYITPIINKHLVLTQPDNPKSHSQKYVSKDIAYQ